MTRSAPALLLLVACGNDTGIKAYNANPVATISSHVDGDTVDANVPLEFWGSVSDPDHEASDLEATWYQGSAVICPALPPDSDGRTSCEVSLAEGDAAIILEVRDPKGATDAAQVTVTATAEPVVNAPPSCTITAPEDDSRVAPGERVDFAGVVADAEDAADALLVRWTSDVDGTLNEDAADSDGDVAFSTADLSVGRHALTLLVTDSGGETCSDTLTLSVGDGPVVTIDAPTDGATYNEGDLVDFLATIDADGADPSGVRLSWESDLDGLLNTDPADSGGLAAFSEDDLGWGTHEITLTATDDLGLSSDDHITLVINGLPSAPTVSISPDPASPSVDLVASVDTPSEDPEGGAVSYTYAWTRDGAATTYDTDTVPESATEDGERWMVTVTPNDGLGDGPSGTATVTIGNGSPSLADVTLSPDPAYEGDTLTCTPGATTDPDGDSVSLSYAWKVSGATVAVTSTTLSSSYFDKGDSVVCVVTPTDGLSDGAAVTSNTADIENTAPVVSEVAISPTDPEVGDTLTCGYTFSDADGDADASTVRWTINGTSAGSGTTLTTSYAGGDTITCTVTPDDGEDAGSNVSASVTIGNTAPVLASATLSPDPAYEGDTLTCTPGSATDADGDSVSYTYAWKVDGTAISRTSSTLSSTYFDRGDAVVCVVTPTDGSSTGSAVTSNTVTIGNTAPEASAVSISPSSPTASSTLTCSYTYSDVDSDSDHSTVSWKINGAIAASGTTLSSGFGGGDSVTCTVTPNDGTDSGTAASKSVTIGNTAPSLASVTLSPDPVYEGDTLTCTPGTATDVDGDSVSYTYAWKVDGTTISRTTSTLSSTYFDRGDAVVCVVTPTDGSLSGSAVTSNTVTIDNTAPEAASVSISPSSPTAGSTLTCSYTFSDDDGDTDHSTVAWKINSTSAGSGATLSSGYKGGDAVTCTVTPNDGTDSGTAVSKSVTITNTAPSLASVTLSPDPAYEGDTLTCTPGSATDVDGDSVSYTYAWKVDGASIARTSSTLSSTYFNRDQDVVCVVTPNDGTTSGTAVTSNTAEIENTAPTASAVSISPTSPKASDTLTCSYTYADVDGDTDRSTVTWKLGTTTLGTGTTLSSGYGGGDSVTCSVTPYDGTTSGTAATTSVTIGNTAPTLASVSLTPTTAYEGDTFTCTPGTATDVDGDSVSYTYAWTVEGASVGVTTSTLSSAYFGRGDDVRCSVTPTDGTTAGTAVASSAVTVSNSKPTITALSISPSSPDTDDTLSLSITSSDADGDAITYTYQWKVNSTAVATTSTLSGSSFVRGDTVTVTVTPSDGTDAGSSSAASVTVANAAPSAPTVDITPSYPGAGDDDILCYVVTASTDLDGDTLDYTVTWEGDGLPYPSAFSGTTGPETTSVTDDTIPAADTDLASVWTCTVTPDDGVTEGDTATAEIDVLDMYEAGYATVTSGPGSAAASYMLGPSITVSSATTLYGFGAWLNTSGSYMRMALYSDSGGSPAALVAYSDIETTTTGDNHLDLSTPVALSAGTYWVMATYSATTYIYYGATTSRTVKYKSAAYSATPTSTFGTASSYSGYPMAYYIRVAD